jgi:hypothetical protein
MVYATIVEKSMNQVMLTNVLKELSHKPMRW